MENNLPEFLFAEMLSFCLSRFVGTNQIEWVTGFIRKILTQSGSEACLFQSTALWFYCCRTHESGWLAKWQLANWQSCRSNIESENWQLQCFRWVWNLVNVLYWWFRFNFCVSNAFYCLASFFVIIRGSNRLNSHKKLLGNFGLFSGWLSCGLPLLRFWRDVREKLLISFTCFLTTSDLFVFELRGFQGRSKLSIELWIKVRQTILSNESQQLWYCVLLEIINKGIFLAFA